MHDSQEVGIIFTFVLAALLECIKGWFNSSSPLPTKSCAQLSLLGPLHVSNINNIMMFLVAKASMAVEWTASLSRHPIIALSVLTSDQSSTGVSFLGDPAGSQVAAKSYL